MSVAEILSTSLETAINRALDWSFNKEELLSPLIGKTCIIFVQEIEKALIFSFNVNGVSVAIDKEDEFRSNPEQSEDASFSEQECWLSISVFAAQQLKQNSQLTKLIKSGQLDFAGNLSILQSLSKLYDQIDFDLEEVLSQYLGDAFAHNVHSFGKKIVSSLFGQLHLLKHTLSDVALDEKPIAVRGIMVTNFCDDIVDLQAHVDRITARMDNVEVKLKKKINKSASKSIGKSLSNKIGNNQS